MVAFSDVLGRRLRAVNAQVFVYEGIAEEYPTIELVFEGLRFCLHTAASGALEPRAEALHAYFLPELDGEVRIQDCSSIPTYAGAVGAVLVRLGEILDGGITCGTIMYFANGTVLYFMNWGDELWASQTLPPPNVLDGLKIRR